MTKKDKLIQLIHSMDEQHAETLIKIYYSLALNKNDSVLPTEWERKVIEDYNAGKYDDADFIPIEEHAKEQGIELY